MTTIGLLHPGEMGASVGASGRANGHRVLWTSEGRGGETQARAKTAGLEDAGTLNALVAASEVILSVCPPHAALDVAAAVAARHFRGVYVDGNAVAPATARSLARVVQAAGADLRGRRHHRPAPRQARHHPAVPVRPRRRAGAAAVRGRAAGGGRPLRRPHRRLGHQDGLRRVDEGLAGAPHGGASAGHGRGRGRAAGGASGCARSPTCPSARRTPPRAPPARRGGGSARWTRSRPRSPGPACLTASTARPASCTAAWRSTRTRRRHRRSRMSPRPCSRSVAHERDERPTDRGSDGVAG